MYVAIGEAWFARPCVSRARGSLCLVWRYISQQKNVRAPPESGEREIHPPLYSSETQNLARFCASGEVAERNCAIYGANSPTRHWRRCGRGKSDAHAQRLRAVTAWVWLLIEGLYCWLIDWLIVCGWLRGLFVMFWSWWFRKLGRDWKINFHER